MNSTAAEIKRCCATMYESDWTRLLLGDSFHPGGLALTRRLGERLDLQPEQRLLDVAAGQGTSAIFLAQQFDCCVVGLDFSQTIVAKATANAAEAGLADRVCFEQGDAEQLHFEDSSFDVIICECAFCTFPDKSQAAREFARVLRPGGRVGLSDLIRSGPLPSELDSLLAWIACIAAAQPLEAYRSYLADAGLQVQQTEAYPQALAEMIKDIQTRLLGAELMLKLNKLDLPDLDLAQAKAMARQAAQAVKTGRLSYALVTGAKTAL